MATQSVTEMFNKLVKEFKVNADAINKTSQGMEAMIGDVFSYLGNEDQMGKFKKIMVDFFDSIDLDELFDSIDLADQVGAIGEEIEKVFQQVMPGFSISSFALDPEKIVDEIEKLLPEDIELPGFPNLKEDLKNIWDLVSSSEAKIKVKKVTDPVPSRDTTKSSPTIPANTGADTVGDTSNEDETLLDKLNTYLKGLVESHTDDLSGLFDKVQDEIFSSSLVEEVNEALEAFIEEITSGGLSFSTFFDELIKLIKNLGESLLRLIKKLITILFDVLSNILEIFSPLFTEPSAPIPFVSDLIQTLIPDRKVTLLTLPALALSTPYVLAYKGLAGEEPPAFPSFPEAEVFFESNTTYGLLQIFKGLLVIPNQTLSNLSGAWVLVDVLANIFLQLVSFNSFEKALQDSKEDDKQIPSVAVWIYQWFSSVVWPLFILGFERLDKEGTKKSDAYVSVPAIGDLVIEGIHFIIFTLINEYTPNDPRAMAANWIDPLPGIVGGLFGIRTNYLSQQIFLIKKNQEEKGNKDVKPNLDQRHLSLSKSEKNLKNTINTCQRFLDQTEIVYEYKDETKIVNLVSKLSAYLSDEKKIKLDPLLDLYNENILFYEKNSSSQVTGWKKLKDGDKKLKKADYELNAFIKELESYKSRLANWKNHFSKMDIAIFELHAIKDKYDQKESAAYDYQLKIIKEKSAAYDSQLKIIQEIVSYFKKNRLEWIDRKLNKLFWSFRAVYTTLSFQDSYFTEETQNQFKGDLENFGNWYKLFNPNPSDTGTDAVEYIRSEANKNSDFVNTLISKHFAKIINEIEIVQTAIKYTPGLQYDQKSVTTITEIEKEIEILDKINDIFALICQVAYGSLVLDQVVNPKD